MLEQVEEQSLVKELLQPRVDFCNDLEQIHTIILDSAIGL